MCKPSGKLRIVLALSLLFVTSFARAEGSIFTPGKLIYDLNDGGAAKYQVVVRDGVLYWKDGNGLKYAVTEGTGRSEGYIIFEDMGAGARPKYMFTQGATPNTVAMVDLTRGWKGEVKYLFVSGKAPNSVVMFDVPNGEQAFMFTDTELPTWDTLYSSYQKARALANGSGSGDKSCGGNLTNPAQAKK